MMEITLRLSDGQKKTFSEQELIAIVEEHLQNKRSAIKQNTTQFIQVPAEGKWFKVNPLTIDQDLFQQKREDPDQEDARQLILQAFEKVKKYPQKYEKPFKTMMPKKTWESKTIGELKELAKSLGDHNADWVEQALEWAQRIANGDLWGNICNKEDTANWYRLVVWKQGYARLVGGSRNQDNKSSASDVGKTIFYDNDSVMHTIPSVVSYNE